MGQPVNMNNISFINHKGTTLTVTFKSTGFVYEYTRVSAAVFQALVKASEEETSDNFKKLFNEIKTNPSIKYKKL